MKFPYKWHLSDGYPAKGIKPNTYKVFGTFLCGGGSTMGYKMAGFQHLGGVEIDKKMVEIYQANHKPKYLYHEDIRDFLARDNLPDELFNLDILDGSPPCTTFSMSGKREKVWGKSKKFSEGQSNQVLDDLVFVYVDLIKRLQPKIAILENVKGIICGNAKAYTKAIKSRMEEAGYRVQIFLLNAASMGVPQKRERVFFIAIRKDIKAKPLKLSFNYPPITYGQINPVPGRQVTGKQYIRLWGKKSNSDNYFSDIKKRLGEKESYFTVGLLQDFRVPPTIIAGSEYIMSKSCCYISDIDACKIGSFPLDFNFLKTRQQYLIGMSVPP